MKLYQKLWFAVTLVLGVACGLFALVAFSPGAVFGVACLGALLGGAVVVLSLSSSLGPLSFATCGRGMLTGAGAGIASLGLLEGTGPSGFLLLLAVAALSPRAVRWALRKSGSRQSAVSPAISPTRMSAQELSFTWRLSSVQMTQSRHPEELKKLAEHRASLLDEMERRDPSGFSRWLLEVPHPASDPTPYLKQEPTGRSDGSSHGL